jgi:beta-glucosidase
LIIRKDGIHMDIQKILGEMTLEEKAALCSGNSTWLTKPLKKYGIPALFMANGSYGMIVSKGDKDVSVIGKIKKAAGVASTLLKFSDTPLIGKVMPSTSFPCSAAIACTWDTDLVFEVGKALGEECNAAGVDILLGPGINIKRTPLCGRNFEYYSEDPCLAGEIGAALVRGVQGEGVAVALKHFALNNTELRRFTVDTVVDERTMREIYLAAFERVVKKAAPKTIMSAYNKINGDYASEKYDLLTKVLREEWGFDGLVMSDWGAVEDRVKALNAGCDLQMPGPKPYDDEKIVAAVKEGRITADTLDNAVRRLLELISQLSPKKAAQPADYEKHHRLAVRVAEEGMVLLKNDGALPWDAGKIRSVAVIGDCAKSSNFLKGGSACIVPVKMEEPLDTLKEYLKDSAEVRYARGYDAADTVDPALAEEAAKTASACDCALIVARAGTADYSEGNERKDIELPEQQIRLIEQVVKVQPNTVVAVICGSAFGTRGWEKGAGAILSVWHAGQGFGEALKNILFGIANPSGRLAETFPLKLADTPAYINTSMNNDKIYYGENIFVGYRYYDKREMEVSYPFGHGLSYTEFTYSGLAVDRTEWVPDGRVRVRLKVKNTGGHAGYEAVQLYVRDTESFLPRPEKELKAFRKVWLAAGEEKEILFEINKRDFSFYSPERGGWVAEEGEYEIMAGASSRDIRLSEKITLQPADRMREGLDAESFLRDWIEDPQGREILRSEFGGLFFDLLFDKNSPTYPLAMTFPLKRTVNNNFLTAKQLEIILQKVKEL